MPWKLSVTAFVSGLDSLSKKRENREIDCGLLKCFLLLQTVFPTLCNMGVKVSVADRANALSEAQSKSCMGRGNIIKRRRNPSIQREESPKG